MLIYFDSILYTTLRINAILAYINYWIIREEMFNRPLPEIAHQTLMKFQANLNIIFQLTNEELAHVKKALIYQLQLYSPFQKRYQALLNVVQSQLADRTGQLSKYYENRRKRLEQKNQVKQQESKQPFWANIYKNLSQALSKFTTKKQTVSKQEYLSDEKQPLKQSQAKVQTCDKDNFPKTKISKVQGDSLMKKPNQYN